MPENINREFDKEIKYNPDTEGRQQIIDIEEGDNGLKFHSERIAIASEDPEIKTHELRFITQAEYNETSEKNEKRAARAYIDTFDYDKFLILLDLVDILIVKNIIKENDLLPKTKETIRNIKAAKSKSDGVTIT